CEGPAAPLSTLLTMPTTPLTGPGSDFMLAAGDGAAEHLSGFSAWTVTIMEALGPIGVGYHGLPRYHLSSHPQRNRSAAGRLHLEPGADEHRLGDRLRHGGLARRCPPAVGRGKMDRPRGHRPHR